MTIQVELRPATRARLAAEAQARGIPLEEYAGTVLDEAVASVGTGSGNLSTGDVRQMLREIAEGSEELPRIRTSAFTRESFYEDRP